MYRTSHLLKFGFVFFVSEFFIVFEIRFGLFLYKFLHVWAQQSNLISLPFQQSNLCMLFQKLDFKILVSLNSFMFVFNIFCITILSNFLWYVYVMQSKCYIFDFVVFIIQIWVLLFDKSDLGEFIWYLCLFQKYD